MKTGELWSLPADSEAIARVVLDLSALSLPPRSPLNFVADTVLVQLLSESRFERKNILIDGLLLVPRRRLAKLGFKLIGTSPVSVDEIEFPCWLADLYGEIRFCRGEVSFPLPHDQAQYLFRRWNIRLSFDVPESLPTLAKEQLERTDIKQSTSIAMTDIRYHPERDRILEELGVDLALPYYRALERELGIERLRAYEAAIS